MGWHFRVCRFGHTHYVFKQEADESCGPSCALMLFQRLRNVKLDSLDSYKGFASYGQGGAKGDYNGAVGTGGNDMARFLRNVLGQSCVYKRGTAQELTDGVLANLRRKRPVVFGVMWVDEHGNHTRGGHWIVADKVTKFLGKQYVCASDPGDGHVHVVEFRDGIQTYYQPEYGSTQDDSDLDDYIEFP